MPISDDLKAIFVHVPKTGGQAIHKVLQLPSTTEALYGVVNDVELTHATAAMVRERRPVEFANYFKFGFVRHPLERLVSEYFFSLQGGYRPYLPVYAGLDFATFVRRVAQLVATPDLSHAIACHLYPQTAFLYDGDTLLVDYVGRHELFEAGMLEVARRLNLKILSLPKVNASEHEPWLAYYDDETMEIAVATYRQDFERFGYTF